MKSFSNIPWKQLYGLRNRIVHDYEGVNLKLVWEIIDNDLEELKQNWKVYPMTNHRCQKENKCQFEGACKHCLE